ncbi:MAG: aminotransferase class III-fold pyridoxal phosphate-dependent enzyme [Spirochaetales bacterium]|nr:aminotransferase class III-fold pyridoxal phosphate-dependent enzyme [Spirochaetales bacterium]
MSTSNGFEKNPPYGKHFASELLVIDKGEGSWLWDEAGAKYLDFGAGIAVNALGYGREDFAATAHDQVKKLVHISNVFANRPALELAELLVKSGPFAAVHFGNSGTEANETALKFARLYSLRKKGEGHHKILSFSNAFHGRSYGALSATPVPKYQDPFRPLVPGFVSSPYNDAAALEKTLTSGFAAVIVEVVQGEGGLAQLESGFIAALNTLCAAHDVILIADEVQTGLGRTGTLYASFAAGLKPDMITLAKPIAGGLPLSATLFGDKVNDLIKLGEHGTTFGGGPVPSALGLLVWKAIHAPGFMEEVKAKGEYLAGLYADMKKEFPFVGEFRGLGLLRGIEIVARKEKPEDLCKTIIDGARGKGLLVLRSGSNVIRIAPPLTITREELKTGMDILTDVFRGLKSV